MARARSHPTYDSAEDWADSMEQHLLHCRELGHSWDAYTASYDNKTRTYDRTLVCASCRTTRHQILDSSGDVIRNGYKYTEGYLAKGYFDHAGHKVPRRVFRLVAVNRVVNVSPVPINRKKNRARAAAAS